MKENPLRLDAFLPYRLSVASNLVSDAIAGAYVRLFALSVPEWRLIAVIAEHAEGMTQNEICLRTRMDKVTVSRAAIALANRGLILRDPNPHDGRSHMVSLSRDGAALYRQVVPQALELERRIFGAIEPEELARFRDILDRISSAAKAVAQNAD